MTILKIKNMVCPRCIMAVTAILERHGFLPKQVVLGEALVEEDLDAQQLAVLRGELQAIGFELLDDPQSQLIEQVRVAIWTWARLRGEHPRLSDYLTSQIDYDYSKLSKLFREHRGVTIERYGMLCRVELVKEKLCDGELSTSEIAYQLGYSSPAHLSAQFKQITSMTPKEYRAQERPERHSWDQM